MNDSQDWDPRSAEVLADPLAAYDRMRRRCPVAHSDYLHYSVFRHADVLHILADTETFSSQASRHVSVPNTMDPPEHTAYRRAIDPYFSAARMASFEPVCRRICAELVAALPRDTPVEIMFGLAHPFAVRAQCAFLGWPDALHEPLRQWIHKKNVATLSGDSHAIAAVANEFDETILAILKERRAAADRAPDDVTTCLMHERVDGQPLRADEIAQSLNRIDKQVEFVVDDYDARDFPRLQRSQELLQRSLEELEQTLRLSDEDRGRPYRAPADIPDDWNAGGFSSEDFAYQIRNMRARELLAAYQERVEMLSARQRNRRLSPSRDWETAVEMGEIARHLALRSSEVPIASQVPFRNAALRLDVLSESLGEYIRDGKDAYAKRHLRHARESLRTCLSYLAVREPGK